MARPARILFPNADYHVISRGNYRKNLFDGQVQAAAFVECLFNLCIKRAWQLHAYVIMTNHFHLCLRTLHADLPEGMQWLLSTFAARFNRYRKAVGHVFQGRYKSLVIEPGGNLLRVVDYIHLNPVRAGMIQLADLSSYRHCSYGALARDEEPMGFNGQVWRDPHAFSGKDGWLRYQQHLAQQLERSQAKTPSERHRESQQMCRGWCIGSEGYRRKLLLGMSEKDRRFYNEQVLDGENDPQMELF